MDEYTVYMHINKQNNKKYIGITKQKPERRWQKGKGYLNTYFGNAIIKYGWDNFEHIILINGLNKENACKLEKALIAIHKSNNRNYGYNISEGGQICDCCLSKRGLEHPNHKRVKMIDANTKKIIKIFDSQSQAAEQMGISRKAITKACRGQLVTYKGFIWEYADFEYCKPQHNGVGNYDHYKSCKPVVMIDNHGEHHYSSVKEASEKTGVTRTSISRYLKNTRKDTKRRWYYES